MTNSIILQFICAQKIK